MKNILVPTDFSECAQNAANAAMRLAVKTKASIHFLHIMPAIDEPAHVPHVSLTGSYRHEKGHAQNELNVLVSTASRLGLMATPLLVLDKGNDRIENYCESLGIDLVVMGSHGATGIRELVMGSNTQRLVRHSRVPVLVIKHSVTNDFNFKDIVFASTFNEEITRSFTLVVTLATLLKANVHILFVNFIDKLVDKDVIDQIVRKLTRPYPTVQFTTNTAEANDEEFGIRQFVEMIQADMVAITTHDKTGFLLRHSVAEDLVNHEDIPVLVLKG